LFPRYSKQLTALESATCVGEEQSVRTEVPLPQTIATINLSGVCLLDERVGRRPVGFVRHTMHHETRHAYCVNASEERLPAFGPSV
jgi:hypothetical protein